VEGSSARHRLKSWLWYRTGIRALTNYRPLSGARLDEITSGLASGFAAHRLREGMEVSTANNSSRVLRRILNLAVEWGVLSSASKIKVLSGERRRQTRNHSRGRGRLSCSHFGTPRINRCRAGGYGNPPRGMLPAALGECNLVQRTKRCSAGDSWEDGCSSSHDSNDCARAFGG
jgi:hypothetical protein